jgi:hypothetical protein
MISAVVVLAVGGYLLVRWLGSAAAPPTSPSLLTGRARPASALPALVVRPEVYDLGEVSQAAGTVTVRLQVANAGQADLLIYEMETSCGCTRAALVVNGQRGPWFGMRGHGPWPTGWSARLRPGQEGVLVVQYDPNAHGFYRGPIDRVVLISSNDPRHPRARVRLVGVQVP